MDTYKVKFGLYKNLSIFHLYSRIFEDLAYVILSVLEMCLHIAIRVRKDTFTVEFFAAHSLMILPPFL